MSSSSELEANDHISKLRLRCLLPIKTQTRTEWLQEHQHKPDWWRYKFAPPPKN